MLRKMQSKGHPIGFEEKSGAKNLSQGGIKGRAFARPAKKEGKSSQTNTTRGFGLAELFQREERMGGIAVPVA